MLSPYKPFYRIIIRIYTQCIKPSIVSVRLLSKAYHIEKTLNSLHQIVVIQHEISFYNTNRANILSCQNNTDMYSQIIASELLPSAYVHLVQ